MEDKTKLTSSHYNLILENRNKLSISGVSDVDSFDEQEIVIYTALGTLTVKGFDLHINKLNVESGELVIEGELDSIAYSDQGRQEKGGGFFAKMFK